MIETIIEIVTVGYYIYNLYKCNFVVIIGGFWIYQLYVYNKKQDDLIRLLFRKNQDLRDECRLLDDELYDVKGDLQMYCDFDYPIQRKRIIQI
jgi:hypothetical protein